MRRSIIGLLFGLFLSSSGYAQNLGPYYLSSVGFCNIREMYVSVATNIGFGREIGCSSTAGYTFIGYFDTTASKMSISRTSPGSVAGVNSELTQSVYGMSTNALDVYSANSQGITAINRGLSYTISTTKPSVAILSVGKELPNHDLMEQADHSRSAQ
ncbi:MAG: hypothetical protein V4858_22605 [Pseudomonadota bacterium]